MKTIFLISSLIFSISSFAKSSSNAERELLCKAIDMQLMIQTADMAIDLGNCLQNKTVKSKLVTEGTRAVEGTVVFNAPFRPSFTVHCELAYTGTPKVRNIVNGLEEGITCN